MNFKDVLSCCIVLNYAVRYYLGGNRPLWASRHMAKDFYFLLLMADNLLQYAGPCYIIAIRSEGWLPEMNWWA